MIKNYNVSTFRRSFSNAGKNVQVININMFVTVKNSLKNTMITKKAVKYHFKCDLCDAGYVAYMCQHLHQRIEEHKGSAV